MEKQEILDRINFIEAEKNKALAHANACDGAIQDCKFWLERLNAKEVQDSLSEPVNDLDKVVGLSE